MLLAEYLAERFLSVLAAVENVETAPASSGFFPEQFWSGLVSTAVFGLLGIVLVLLSVALFDKISLSRVSLHDELKNGNLAVAGVLSALILGMCYLITHIVH